MTIKDIIEKLEKWKKEEFYYRERYKNNDWLISALVREKRAEMIQEIIDWIKSNLEEGDIEN